MEYRDDPRIVMTLDAGGTKFNFSAVQGEKEIIEPVTIPSKGENLEFILKNIIEGFRQVAAKIKGSPAAISFAFPGPADYENGIIGDLQNLPSFRGGVALGPMLEEIFGIPVFINNDGDLFAYGEAISGLLPEVNRKLEALGNPKRYRNLMGVTFGTGFGGGIVSRGELFFGDNSAQGEINRVRNRLYVDFDAEESVSIRGIKTEYMRLSGIRATESPGAKEISEIAEGRCPGNQEAAREAYHLFGRAAGDAIANAITLVDGLIVIGGGLSPSHSLYMPGLIEEMNCHFDTFSGSKVERLEISAFNLEDPGQAGSFYRPTNTLITVPFSQKKVNYEPGKKIGVGLSRLGTSNAVSIGAYAFALNKMGK
jgi:glucokinase